MRPTAKAEPGNAHRAVRDGYVWTVKGDAALRCSTHVLIARARQSAYLAAMPSDLSTLRPALERALERGVRTVVFTTARFHLPGARVVVSPPPRTSTYQQVVPSTVLVIDGREALVGEQLGPGCVRGCWTQSPLLVSMVEHYLLRGGQHRFLVAEHTL